MIVENMDEGRVDLIERLLWNDEKLRSDLPLQTGHGNHRNS